MIYTTYFAKLKKLPLGIIPISICGKAPDWYNGIQYKKLAPSYNLLMTWKQNHDDDYYIERFNREVLGRLDKDSVIKELYKLSEGKDIALVCYEKSGDFCHRYLVSEWLNEFGIECKEWSE